MAVDDFIALLFSMWEKFELNCVLAIFFIQRYFYKCGYITTTTKNQVEME
jgi:hypothetical protein